MTVGYLRVMFTVDDIDGTLSRLRARGAQLVGEDEESGGIDLLQTAARER